MNVQEIANFIIKQIETISVTAVNVLREHTFSTKIVNLPKVQDVRGTVVVGNQKNVEKQIVGLKKEFVRGLSEVKAAIKSTVYPDTVTVKNIKDTPLCKEAVIPPFPKEMTVTVKNPSDKIEISNLSEIIKKLESLDKSIKAVKVSPIVKVDAPNVDVKIPDPKVIFNAETLISDDPKKSIPVRLSDGKEFYEAVSNIIGGLKKLQKVEVTNGNMLTSFETNEVEKVSATLTYNGLEDKDGTWCIQKIDSSSGTSVRFATQAINSSLYPTFALAWAERASLTYGYFSEAF